MCVANRLYSRTICKYESQLLVLREYTQRNYQAGMRNCIHWISMHLTRSTKLPLVRAVNGFAYGLLADLPINPIFGT